MAMPENPYRRGVGVVDGMREMSPLLGDADRPVPTARPRIHGGRSGPGLTADDIDRMCRQHYLDGFGAAKRESEIQLALRDGVIADAFDEGAAAQDELNTSLVLDGARRRLIADVLFPLRELLEGPKARQREGLRALLESVHGWREDLETASHLARHAEAEARRAGLER